MKKLIAATIIFLFVNIISLAQVSELKILPGDGAEGAEFGISVSISGDYTIACAWRDNDNGWHSGAAYIFKRDGANWIEEQKLIPSGGGENGHFGSSVSISGAYVIVSHWAEGGFSGSAYIFRRDGSNWIEAQKLLASDGAAGDFFGYSVSISGDYAIVGAPLDDDNGESSGSAYIFKRDGVNWIEEKKLIPSGGALDSLFGGSVSISGDYAIVGAYGDDGNGSVYVFRRNGANWIEEMKLIASDGALGDQFGYSISISGNYAIVGANEDDDNGTSSGSAYIFRRDGVNWIEEKKLTASDGALDALFGWSVSISGDYAIVGAYGDDGNGSAYIFRRDGANWIEEMKLIASDSALGDQFGYSTSISGDYTIVGAVYDDDNGDMSGSAYIYGGFVVGVEEEKSGVPIFFKLDQNYPNPFNPSTKIKYQIPELSFVTLKVYDVLGSEIITLVNEEKPIGSYEVDFNSHSGEVRNLPSGIYFYRLQVYPANGGPNKFTQVKKMILLK